MELYIGLGRVHKAGYQPDKYRPEGRIYAVPQCSLGSVTTSRREEYLDPAAIAARTPREWEA